MLTYTDQYRLTFNQFVNRQPKISTIFVKSSTLDVKIGTVLRKWKFYFRTIDQKIRVFANGPGDRGSIPGLDIPKTQKMVVHVTYLTLSIIR